jgi:hypothetical protein
MPPKLPSTQHIRQPSNISDMSVDEILDKYSDDSHLLNHILFAKAQEDRVTIETLVIG